MKRLLCSLLICFSLAAFAQKDTIAPGYLRYPTLPSLQLLLGDSASKYTVQDLPKKKPVLLMIFSPDCEHCQHETEQIIANKEALKDVHIVMATTLPLYKMNSFAERYHLSDMENVIVGRDQYYLLPGFYQMRMLPYMALYDKKGKLIRTFEGNITFGRVLEAFSQAK